VTSAKLIHHSPIYLIARAVRTCSGTLHLLDSTPEGLGPLDKSVICNKILKLGKPYSKFDSAHESVLEHAVYTFELISSRAVLQQVTTHRMTSRSTESSRIALHKVLKSNAEDCIVPTGDEEIDKLVIKQVKRVAKLVKRRKGSKAKSNDRAKYAICEALKTRLQFTINARSLRNVLTLRTAPDALWEIRELAYAMFNELPEDHKFLFEDCVYPLDKD
jgi:thymidylate synthase (FAD)